MGNFEFPTPLGLMLSGELEAGGFSFVWGFPHSSNSGLSLQGNYEIWVGGFWCVKPRMILSVEQRATTNWVVLGFWYVKG